MAQAKKKTTKTKPAVPAKPVKMTKLAGGGERPETRGDRTAAQLIAKAEKRKPDGAKAFHLASDMEDDFNEIKHLIDAIHLMAEGASDDAPHVGSALFGISNGLGCHLQSASEKRLKIFHQTWGYAFAAQPEAAHATVADFDGVIAAAKVARSDAKQRERQAKGKAAKEASR